jgi:hypothetical protein
MTWADIDAMGVAHIMPEDKLDAARRFLAEAGDLRVGGLAASADQHAPGTKLDAGKPRVGLVLDDFHRAVLAIAEVGTYGAVKYSEHGWLSVPNGEDRYEDAMLRHWLAASSEERDTESGLHHLSHMAWNALAMLELYLTRKEEDK